MASTNFVVTSLPAYVQDNRDILLKNFALVGDGTRSRISIQTGIKKDAYINFLDLSPVLQDGTACEFTPSGAATLTQRTINTAAIKVDMDICPRNLRGKYAEYLIRINATSEELPFEQYIMDGVVREINKKIENLIWKGDTSLTNNADLKWIDGFLKLAGADNDVIDVTLLAANTAYQNILLVYNALTEEALERGAEIYVSPAIFRAFMQDMVSANFYHYNPGNDNFGEFLLPGTDVRVVRTPGLAGSTSILGTFPANLYYGTDMEGDEEDIDLWYSKDDRVFKLEALWNSGVQFAFPAHVVLGTV